MEITRYSSEDNGDPSELPYKSVEGQTLYSFRESIVLRSFGGRKRSAEQDRDVRSTVEPRYNEPRCNEFLDIAIFTACLFGPPWHVTNFSWNPRFYDVGAKAFVISKLLSQHI